MLTFRPLKKINLFNQFNRPFVNLGIGTSALEMELELELQLELIL